MTSRAYEIATILSGNKELSSNRFTMTLDSFKDVDITGVDNNDLLEWDNVNQKWKEQSSTLIDYTLTTSLEQEVSNFLGGSVSTSFDTIREISNSIIKNRNDYILLEDQSRFILESDDNLIFDFTNLNFIYQFKNRKKTKFFVADGNTQTFYITHLAGNLDVWIDGIYQTPEITDSNADDNSHILSQGEYDYYSSKSELEHTTLPKTVCTHIVFTSNPASNSKIKVKVY